MQWPVFFATLVPAVWIAYHLIERPFIELGKRLAVRLHHPAKTTAPLPAAPGETTLT
jgi:peptidoglycan/LPS O-acetylase OafA/YrhL